MKKQEIRSGGLPSWFLLLLLPLPIPMLFLLPALLVALVPTGSPGDTRGRLTGLLLLLGLIVGGHMYEPDLRRMSTSRGPYAVFFWTLITIVTTLCLLAFLYWVRWFEPVAR